jgi:hypothetical protein
MKLERNKMQHIILEGFQRESEALLGWSCQMEFVDVYFE